MNKKDKEKLKILLETQFTLANTEYKLKFPKWLRWFVNLDFNSWYYGVESGMTIMNFWLRRNKSIETYGVENIKGDKDEQ